MTGMNRHARWVLLGAACLAATLSGAVASGSHSGVRITIFGYATTVHATRAVYLSAGWG
jgi:hypothetical protein